MKRVRYFLETIPVILLYGLAWLLPINWSSWLFGTLFRLIGPLLPVNRVAQTNLNIAFPNLGSSEKHTLIRECWENLGRMTGEYPHITRLKDTKFHKHVTLINSHIYQDSLKKHDQLVLLSGHFANLEIPALSSVTEPINISIVYRKVNNPYLEKLLRFARKHPRMNFIQKGQVKPLVSALQNKHCIGLLIDQKFNQGATINFFGQPATTSTAAVDLAVKFNLPIVMLQVIRKKGPYFDVVFHDPLEATAKNRAEVLQQIHTSYENWIKEHPSQWFWFHKRWGKELYKKLTR